MKGGFHFIDSQEGLLVQDGMNGGFNLDDASGAGRLPSFGQDVLFLATGVIYTYNEVGLYVVDESFRQNISLLFLVNGAGFRDETELTVIERNGRFFDVYSGNTKVGFLRERHEVVAEGLILEHLVLRIARKYSAAVDTGHEFAIDPTDDSVNAVNMEIYFGH